ncbi:two-component system response regulator LytT [Dysgonomonadaceae bacterium PH5-43]|nr:two-component system response regulator LytT [Dysgonomonadaceae bacterium PH5-43]
MRTLIIEDEIVAADALKSLIKEINPLVEIIETLQTIDESVEWFQHNAMPELVFMDIHLADGSAFSIFDEIEITCPIIFVTAYDEYALKAFEVNSIDYLLKPIAKKDLERAFSKLENLSSYSDYNDDNKLLKKLILEIKQEKNKQRTFFLVPEKDKLIPLLVNNIACIYIDNKMIKAQTFDGTKYYMDSNLDELMIQLNPELFYRANRQFIVAKKAIKDITLWFGNKLVVNLSVDVPERIIVSKARAGEFKRWFVQ